MADVGGRVAPVGWWVLWGLVGGGGVREMGGSPTTTTPHIPHPPTSAEATIEKLLEAKTIADLTALEKNLTASAVQLRALKDGVVKCAQSLTSHIEQKKREAQLKVIHEQKTRRTWS